MSGHPLEIVHASAGTGKTFQLTNRYLSILLAPGDRAGAARIAPRILATTFTRKAAAEIRDRIISRLSLAATSDAAAEHLSNDLAFHFTRVQCLSVLRGICDVLADLRIMTIDSLLVGMVLRAAPECGLREGWQLGEVDQDEAIRASAVDAVLANSDQEELLAFLHILHQSGYGRSVHREISNAVAAAYTAYLATRRNPAVWERIEPGNRSTTDESIEALIERVERLDPPLTKSGSPAKVWVSAFEITQALLAEKDWGALLTSGLGAKVAAGDETYSRHEISGLILDTFQEIVATAQSAIRTQALRRNLAVRELMEGFHHTYRHAKAEHGLYIFDDMPILLSEADARGELLEMQYRLDGGIDHVLLDEFQDTSIAQFDLLRPIVEELISSGGGRSVFVVGDVKQSLYGWRDAERDLLPGLSSLLWPDALTRTMSRSYRSAPLVMDTINRVFERIADLSTLEDCTGIREWQDSFDQHESAEHLDDMGSEIRLIEAPPRDDEDRKDAVVRIAAERAAAAKQVSPECSIGVLVRRKDRIPAIVTAIRAHGIDAVEEGGNPITDSPAVCAALSVLQLADHPGDSMAQFHVATSVFGIALGLEDPQDQSEGARTARIIRERLIDEGYEPFLRRLMRSCDGDLSPRDRARFEQLLDLAAEYDQRAETRPSEFVEMAEQRRIDEPSRGTVRVMTVHGAKGLEFDCVILADLDTRWQLKPGGVLTRRPDVISPIEIASLYPNEETRLASEVLDNLHQHATERMITEELCVLYVAMTRAANVLEMVIEPRQHTGPSAANVLREALSEQEGNATIRGAIFESTSGTWWKDLDNQQADPAQLQHADVQWKVTPADSASWQTTSATHDTSTTPIASILDPFRKSSLERGSIVHKWMERIGWIDDGLPSREDLLHDGAALGYPDTSLIDLIEQWGSWMENPDVIHALSQRAHANGDDCDEIVVRNEWGYILDPQSSNPNAETGFIDRLVVGLRDQVPQRAHVIDYKTDTGIPTEIANRYTPQVQTYMRNISRALDIDPSRVTGQLLLLAEGCAIDVDQPAAGESES